VLEARLRSSGITRSSMTDRTEEASRLARLLRDVEELEKTRSALLQRLDQARSDLVLAGDRTAAIRASVDLLCDHISDVVTAAAEMTILEHEIQEADRSLEDVRREVSVMAFESESLQETLDEADEELERLSSILVERRGKHSKGH
jgi:predicted  nucleic acid-binding Zn-ribbon protein